MSDHLPGPNDSDIAPLDGHLEEDPTATQTLPTPADGPVWTPGDDGDDADEEWVSTTTRGIRLGVPAAVLIALVLVAGGFWVGAALQKSHGGATSALASVAARFRSGAAGTGATGGAGAGASRFGGLFGGAAGIAGTAGTAGTISVVNGDTLYVDDTLTGSIVKVTLTKSTTITRNADAAAIDLRPGDTVTVQGPTGSSGAVTATSVTATASGVSSGFGGFGRGLGTGGTGTGAATGSTGSNTTTTPALFGGG
jgi:hypothetical protein